MKYQKILILLSFLIIGFIFRLSDHPANFSPILSLALVAVYFFSKRISLALLFGMMFLSDLFLGFYDWHLMAVVYGSLAIAGLLGYFLKNKLTIGRVAIVSLSGSLLFFFLTNLAVWAFSSWYSADINGLIACFVSGVPFFKNTLLGDLFFSGIFFGSIMVWEKYAVTLLSRVARSEE